MNNFVSFTKRAFKLLIFSFVLSICILMVFSMLAGPLFGISLNPELSRCVFKYSFLAVMLLLFVKSCLTKKEIDN